MDVTDMVDGVVESVDFLGRLIAAQEAEMKRLRGKRDTLTNRLTALEEEIERLHAEHAYAYVDVVFGDFPSHMSRLSVEVEDADGAKFVLIGKWMARDDGCWVLRIPTAVQKG